MPTKNFWILSVELRCFFEGIFPLSCFFCCFSCLLCRLFCSFVHLFCSLFCTMSCFFRCFLACFSFTFYSFNCFLFFLDNLLYSFLASFNRFLFLGNHIKPWLKGRSWQRFFPCQVAAILENRRSYWPCRYNRTYWGNKLSRDSRVY